MNSVAYNTMTTTWTRKQIAASVAPSFVALFCGRDLHNKEEGPTG